MASGTSVEKIKLFPFFTWSCAYRVVELCGWKLFLVNNNITDLMFHVTLQDQLIKGLCEFMEWSSSLYIPKPKYFEIKRHPFYLWNISEDFPTNNMKKKTGLNGCVYDLSVDCQVFDICNITNIHRCLLKKHDINNVWVK